MSFEASAAEAPAPAIGEALSAPAPAPASPAAPAPEISRAEQFDQALNADLSKVWAKNNPPRDPVTKQFVKAGDPAEATDPAAADPAKGAAEAAVKNPADLPEDAKPEPAKATPPVPAIDAPHSWSAAEKAQWASVPPALQTYIAKREADAHQAITRAGEQHKQLEQQVKTYEPFEQLITAHKDHFVKHGITPAQSFATLLDVQRRFEANPAAGLVQLGLQYGIDLRGVFSGQQQHAQIADDPRIAQLETRNATLEKRLAAFESKVTERETAERTAQEADVAKVITDFAKDKPYFADVKALMGRFLNPVRDNAGNIIGPPEASTLDEAYDMAINAKPDIRSRIQEDQRKQDEVKRKAEEAKRADEARKANSVNVKSDTATRATPKSWEDEVAEMGRRAYRSG